MKIRAIDFVGNPGGGLRFVVELLNAIEILDPGVQFEFISQGRAYHRYLDVFKGADLDLELVELNSSWSLRLRQSIEARRFPGKTFIKNLVSPTIRWHYQIPPELFHDCDVVWFPWLHWHRIPVSISKKVVGSFHDAIILQYETNLARSRVNDERETVRQWIQSEATLITSSNATVNSLADLFGIESDRFSVTPLSGEHLHRAIVAPTPLDFPGLPADFVIYPANIFPHKNHETLLRAIAMTGCILPLVLTGEGTDLMKSDRGQMLLELAESLGLDNQCLYAMGYLSDEDYNILLDHASALVMCSIAEGGGSFPVLEAMLRGKPVICSDIPVMREQLERTGGEVIWFSPDDYGELAEKLCYLRDHQAFLSERAESQITAMKRRSWRKVAEEYLDIFTQVSQRQEISPHGL